MPVMAMQESTNILFGAEISGNEKEFGRNYIQTLCSFRWTGIKTKWFLKRTLFGGLNVKTLAWQAGKPGPEETAIRLKPK